MLIPETVIVLKLDVVLSKTIGELHLIVARLFQQCKELRMGILKLFIVKYHQDTITGDKKDQQRYE